MPKNSSPSNTAPWPSVNRAAGAITFDVASFCGASSHLNTGALDQYYERARQVVERSLWPDVAYDSMLLRLLVIEVVSAVEQYFRVILGSVAALCPVAAKIASTRVVTLGAVQFYRGDVALGVLDGVSLAAAGELTRQTKSFLGMDIPVGSPLAASLAYFERVCHLRHAIAHSQSNLGAKNAAELAVSLVFPCEVVVDSLRLQNVVAVVHNVARSFNTFIFEQTLSRWTHQKIITGRWRADMRRFSALMRLFHSSVDHGSVDLREAYVAMVAVLKAQGRL